MEATANLCYLAMQEQLCFADSEIQGGHMPSKERKKKDKVF